MITSHQHSEDGARLGADPIAGAIASSKAKVSPAVDQAARGQALTALQDSVDTKNDPSDLSTGRSLASLRDFFTSEKILICFNGPISRTLISEIGVALKEHIHSSTDNLSSAMDVFSVYIEMSQNIRHYSAARGYREPEATATVVIAETLDGHYIVSAGNVVELADGEALLKRLAGLAALDKRQLKQLYKDQLRQPRVEGASTGAGLGLIDVARKTSAPLQCSLDPLNAGQVFLTLRATI
jgi:Family of unknown function (DUF6272)